MHSEPSEPTGSSERERRLDEVVTAYVKAVEAGEHPEPGQWLERYPDLAEELKSFIAAQKQVADMAGSLPINIASETVGLEVGSLEGKLGTVRYVGDYELLEEIARGGMGVVYKARQVSLNRVVALKMILAGQLASKADVQRFRSEAESAGKLDHPNIVPIYEVGEHQGQQYFSMKLIEGGSLASEIARFCDRPREAVRLVSLVTRAVHHAHQRGLLHRDLKPSNILLDTKGVPHVADFGLAKKVEGDDNATRSGAIVGTPAYMAPEQARAEKSLTTAIDVWSLGAILYELLTGRQPFRGDDAVSTLMKVVNDEPVKLCLVNAYVERDLETICLKCLEKDPVKRFGSADALAEDLERWLRGEPILARPSSAAERILKWTRRHPAVAAAYALLLLATLLGTVGGAMTWLWLRADESRLQAETARQAADTATEEAKKSRDELANAHARLQTETNLRQKADAKVIQVTRLARYASDVQVAQREWEAFNIVRAEEILDACPDDLRGWEWRHLKDCCRRRALPFSGHTSAIHGVCFSPDGMRLASVAGDSRGGPGEVKVWDVTSGQQLLSLPGRTSVCFSPNGRLLAAASRDPVKQSGVVKIWDAVSGQEVLTIKSHLGPVTGLAFSPDSKRLASVSGDRTLKVWDTTTGKQELSLAGYNCVAFSPDGKRLASESIDPTVKVWDASSGKEILSLNSGAQAIRSLCFSPDGKRLAVASGDKIVRVWDAANGILQTTVKGHIDDVKCVVFSADGKRLATASRDRSVRVWEAASGKELHSFRGHHSEVTAVSFCPDGNFVASVGEDKTMLVWNAATGPEVLSLAGHSDRFGKVCYSLDGKRLAAAGRDMIKSSGKVWIWDASSGKALLTLQGHTREATSVCFSPNGMRLASTGLDNSVKEWDVASGRELLSFQGHSQQVLNACYSPDGKRLASASEDGVKVWNATSGQVQLNFRGHANMVRNVFFSPDGSRVASASWHLETKSGEASGAMAGEVKVWNSANGQELLMIRGHTREITNVCFSPDGHRLASSSLDKSIKVWDAATGQEILSLQGHLNAVTCVCFSPDGKRLASTCWDGLIKVWDAASGQELLTLKGHTSGVMSVCFSPDGKRLASASDDRTVKVWASANIR